MKHIKELIALIFVGVSILALAACAEMPEGSVVQTTPAVVLPPYDETTAYGDHCTTSGGTTHLPSVMPSVHFASGGVFTYPYASLIYAEAADGELMFRTVSEMLPYYEQDIPSVTMYEDAVVYFSDTEGYSVYGGDVFDIYNGVDYEKLGENLTLTEITEKGKSEWREKTVYLYFEVLFSAITDDRSTFCYGYFLKISFDSKEEPVTDYSVHTGYLVGTVTGDLFFVAKEDGALLKKNDIVRLKSGEEENILAPYICGGDLVKLTLLTVEETDPMQAKVYGIELAYRNAWTQIPEEAIRDIEGLGYDVNVMPTID